MSAPHDMPSAAGLVEAVREFLERDVMAATQGRVQFHTRVAINALGMVERESPPPAPPSEADRELARRIRAGDVPEDAIALLKEQARKKLRIVNPSYLDRYR